MSCHYVVDDDGRIIQMVAERDRAWHAGDDYRLIRSLFEQARARLKPGGRFYLLVSSDSDLAHLRKMIRKASFQTRLIDRYSFLIESLLIYELQAD